jgi:hypothetical protein
MNVLVLGDIFGRPGRRVVAQHLPQLKEAFEPELIVANGENAAGGFGLTKKVVSAVVLRMKYPRAAARTATNPYLINVSNKSILFTSSFPEKP